MKTTFKELQAQAKQLNIPKRTTFNKAQLTIAISNHKLKLLTPEETYTQLIKLVTPDIIAQATKLANRYILQHLPDQYKTNKTQDLIINAYQRQSTRTNNPDTRTKPQPAYAGQEPHIPSPSSQKQRICIATISTKYNVPNPVKTYNIIPTLKGEADQLIRAINKDIDSNKLTPAKRVPWDDYKQNIQVQLAQLNHQIKNNTTAKPRTKKHKA